MFGSKKRNPEDDVKELSRAELLEMLIEETREAEDLRTENERLKQELDQCRKDLGNVNSLELVLRRLEKIAGITAEELKREQQRELQLEEQLEP